MNILKNKKLYFLISLLFLLMHSFNSLNEKGSPSKITKSEIRLTEDGYRIFLNESPFYIKGAGIDVDKGNIDLLAEHGANSIRTWSTDNGKEVLDKAHELDLKVMMGI